MAAASSSSAATALFRPFTPSPHPRTFLPNSPSFPNPSLSKSFWCVPLGVFGFHSNPNCAFRRLGASVNKLSKVVSEAVPGTLSSLKLSSMELNDLTQKLGNLRHIISGVRIGRKEESSTSSRSYHKKNPAS